MDEPACSEPSGSKVLADSNRFGNRLCMLDARADGGAVEVVAGEVETRNLRELGLNGRNALRVAEIVLGDSAGILGNSGNLRAQYQVERHVDIFASLLDESFV